MARVVGIGGIFVKSSDPAKLRDWYRDALQIDVSKWGAKMENSAGSVGVWNPFDAATKHFEPSKREFMINLRVDDLDGLLAHLRARGDQVLDRGESSPFGKFGYVVDPEGTLLELWEPGSGT